MKIKLLTKIIAAAIYLKYIWMIKIVWLNKSNKRLDFSIYLLLKNKLIARLRKRVIIISSNSSKLFLIPHQHSKKRIIFLAGVNCCNMRSAKICFKKPTLLDYLRWILNHSTQNTSTHLGPSITKENQLLTTIHAIRFKLLAIWLLH